MQAIFEPDGDALVPTALARGPWDPTAMHGGPPSALLMRAVEGVETPDGVTMGVARLTVELLRPIPLEPLTVHAELVRPGRRIQLVDATIRRAATGDELVRGRALRIREAPVPLPYEDPVRGPLLVAGEETSPLQRTAALSDMGNGVSGIVGFDTHMFINPELSIHLWRVPAGEWIGLRCRSDLGRRGIGLASTSLYDGDGIFGRAEQSLLVDTR